MSKNINANLKSFKVVVVALFAFAVLSIDCVAWGATYLTIRGRRINTPITTPPTYSEIKIYVNAPIQGQPEHHNTSGLSFPVTGYTTLDGLLYWLFTETLTESEVRHFYHNEYVTKRNYYEIRSTPSLQQNCFGYATGMNLWLTRSGFETVLYANYKSYTRAEDFGGTVILEYSGHAVLAETSKQTVNEATEGTIVKTHEKNGASGIYGRDLNLLYRENDGFYVDIMFGSVSAFWKPN